MVILDQLRGKKPGNLQNYLSRMYGLVFYHLVVGRVYSAEEIRRWLQSCGFNRIKIVRLIRSGLNLIIGRLT